MQKDEAMNKIKEQLKKLMAFSVEAPVEEKKMDSIKLKDGTELCIVDGTDLGVGVEIYTIDKDGNQTPTPDGDYELEDGRTITVASGKVSVLSEVPADKSGDQTPENPASDAPVANAADPNAPAVDPNADPVEARIKALEDQIAQILEILQGMGNMQEATMTKLSQVAAEPATTSIKMGKTVANVEFGTFKDEIAQMRELREKFKMNGNATFTATKG